jgi:protein-L-isoaspartate(D-aspartate) O-methyltransferase
LSAGAAAHGPFAAILLEGAVPEVPQALLDQLADGGRLVGVIAHGGVGRAQVHQRTGKTFDARAAFDANAPPLPGFAREAGFVF